MQCVLSLFLYYAVAASLASNMHNPLSGTFHHSHTQHGVPIQLQVCMCYAVCAVVCALGFAGVWRPSYFLCMCMLRLLPGSVFGVLEP